MGYKQYLKRNLPSLFYCLKYINHILNIDQGRGKIVFLKDLIKYRSAIKNKQVYYGPLFYAGDVDSVKRQVMEQFIKREVKENFKLIEIGSWQGASAILWGNACKKRGVVFCVEHFDIWESMPKKYWVFLESRKSRELFFHNIKSAGLKNTVLPLIGKSEIIIPILKQGYFDVVYIDGDHAYESCLKDIQNSIPLLKDGGVICGDDLNMQLNEVEYEITWANRDIDGTIIDTKSSHAYHPGVTLAVNKIFGPVSVKNTFWAMRKTGNTWEKIQL